MEVVETWTDVVIWGKFDSISLEKKDNSLDLCVYQHLRSMPFLVGIRLRPKVNVLRESVILPEFKEVEEWLKKPVFIFILRKGC